MPCHAVPPAGQVAAAAGNSLAVDRIRLTSQFAAENKAWLRVYRRPAYAPGLYPAEGIWPLPKRSKINFAAAGLDSLVRIVKRKLKKIRYRPT